MMQDPRFNPMFNPNGPMLPVPGMVPPFNFDPRFPPQSVMQDPRLMSRFEPPENWVERILIFPDGSFQHTIRDPRAMVIVSEFSLFQAFVLYNSIFNRVWLQLPMGLIR